MAFTVNEFRDLLEILRTRPEWKEELRRELLGEELLSLPSLVRELTKAIEEMNKRLYRVQQDVEVLKADVAELKTDVTVLKTDVAELKTDVTVLKADVAELKTDVTVLKADVAELKTDVTVLKADVAVLKADVAELKTDVTVLKADVAELKTDVTVLKADVAVLKADVAELKADVTVLKTDVASLKGESLERKYRERPFVYFRRIVRKPKILTDGELDDLLSAALDNGVLTEADVEEISRLDAVVRGRRLSDDCIVYLAVEISAKIDRYDVERAVRRARLLEKLPGVVAMPVVAGEALTSEGAQTAKQVAAWTVTDGYAVEGATLSA
ncbi:MAG: hypothetical protein KatS3mg052_1796 [Candidatus Roseilinea sp.]|nr:MAG: hypothetical protein KatS3mg052_1796 [Candidatus Roseilinea sp.]